MTYQLLKVIHIVSMLVWIAGMFRLFDFYQNASGREGERAGVLSFDSRWTTPAMLSAWLAGAGMVYLARWWNHHWFLRKLLLAIILSGTHGVLVGRLARGPTSSPPARYRVAIAALVCGRCSSGD